MFRPLLPKPDASVSQTQTRAPSPPHQGQGATALTNTKRRQRAASRRQVSVAWLDAQWNGPDWLPPDLRAGLPSVGLSEPANKVVYCLHKITKLLLDSQIDLRTVWQASGDLRLAIKRGPEHKTRHLPPSFERPHLHLTVATAKAMLKTLRTDRPKNASNDHSPALSSDFFPDFDGNADTAGPGSPTSSVDVFYDVPGTPSPELEPAMMPVPRRLRSSNIETPMVDAEASSLASEIMAHAHKTEHLLAKLTWAQAAHQAATNNLAQLVGKDEALKAFLDASDNYIRGLRDDLDSHYVDDDAPNTKRRRRSATMDDVKRDHYAHLQDAEIHCTNALPEDIDPSAKIDDAKLQEQQACDALFAAKVRVKAVGHILEDEIRKMKDDLATTVNKLYEKRQVADDWDVVAEQEDWEGILDDGQDEE
ncbi:hypothetical protein F53441_10596 [Fusarium austroafricanum]|uniref:Uncharacterized protein n=1 Tax=Fusarium austroafricanum TaxID=2364996 RepID=A0A8H4K6N7_9HYPO|nr:hypothetical protein F53441_10596 [Fusarium austroafricanum]